MDRVSRCIDHRSDGLDLGENIGQKALTTESRIDAHDQDEVDVGQHVLQHALVGMRIETDPGSLSALANLRQGSLEVRTRFGVDGDYICARVGICIDGALWLDNHQVHIHRFGGRPCSRLHHGWADREVGNEAAIHHVNVDPVGSSRLNGSDLVRQAPKICR